MHLKQEFSSALRVKYILPVGSIVMYFFFFFLARINHLAKNLSLLCLNLTIFAVCMRDYFQLA